MGGTLAHPAAMPFLALATIIAVDRARRSRPIAVPLLAGAALFPSPAPFVESDGVFSTRPGDTARVRWIVIGTGEWAHAPAQQRVLRDIAARWGFVRVSQNDGVEVWEKLGHFDDRDDAGVAVDRHERAIGDS